MLEVLEDRTVPSCVETLGVGNNRDPVGTLTVEAFDTDQDTDIDQIRVTYQTTGGSFLSAAHLWIGNTDLLDGPRGPLPTNMGGNPVPGQFPFRQEDLPPGTQTVVFLIGDEELDGFVYSCGDRIGVVAHADINGTNAGGAWAGETPVPGAKNNATFFVCTLDCETEGEGLSHGFWKQEQHFIYWTDYTPDQTVGSVFTEYTGTYANSTLLEALDFQGGPDLEGAERILLRNAVAAVLNAAHLDIDYPLSLADVISQVTTALGGTREDMLALEATLDVYNNLGNDEFG